MRNLKPHVFAVLAFLFIIPLCLQARSNNPSLTKPDLAVGQIGCDKQFNVGFRVYNRSARPFSGKLWFKMWDGERLIEEWSKTLSIPGCGSKAIQSDYNLAVFSTYGKGLVKVQVDSKNLISESNENNNYAIKSIVVPLKITNITFKSFEKMIQLHQDVSKNPTVTIGFKFRRVIGTLAHNNMMLHYSVKNSIRDDAVFVPFTVSVLAGKNYVFASYPLNGSNGLSGLQQGVRNFTLTVRVDPEFSIGNPVIKEIPCKLRIFGGFVRRTKTVMAKLTVGHPVSTARGGRACPFLYLPDLDGPGFVKHCEVVRNKVGKSMEALESTALAGLAVRNGKISIIIREEKDEVSFIDYVALRVNGATLHPTVPDDDVNLLSESDDRYLIMKKGQQIALSFDLPGKSGIVDAVLLTEGFYEITK